MEEIGTYDVGEKKSLEEFLNSPEMEKLRQEMEESRKEYEKDTESFWNNLSYEDQLKAFYYVTSKIYQGDVVDNGSYRHVIYDLMGFSAEAYSLMMDSHYLELHNLIADGMEYRKINNAKSIIFGDNTFMINDKCKIDFAYNEKDESLTLEEKDLFKFF